MTPWKYLFQLSHNRRRKQKKRIDYTDLKMESLEVRSLLAGDTVNPDSLDTILSSPEETTEETSAIIQSLIESGTIAASPSPGLPTPGDYQGNPLEPIVTNNFSQAVPSNDWWSSVHFAEYGDSFSAPLFIHPITAKASETGMSISAQTIQSAFETGPTLREYQVAIVADLHVDLFGSESATEFALDSYSDWAFTGKWNGVSNSPSTTMAQGSPFVWIENAELNKVAVRWDDGAGSVSLEGETAIFTVADRTYGLYAPEGSSWQALGQSVTLDVAGSGTVAIALLPGSEPETLASFREVANHPISGTQFGYSRGADPYSLKLNYDYSLSGEGSSGETIVALYPHLARHTQIDTLPSAAYASARGSMTPVKTGSIQVDLAARGVLPALPSTLDDAQKETLRQLLITDEAATDPAGYFSRFADPYWSGKSLLKLMQLSQVAELVGETDIRDDIHQAVKDGLNDWFHFDGNSNDRHFAYNAQWDTLQAYPDAFYSGQMLNDHHFHMGYLVHSAALLGMSDPAWAADNQAIIDLIVKDVAGTDKSDPNLPRLRNFSPMAGHSWASGHGAFSRGNNHESSSEAMNFATGLILWGEVTGQSDTTLLGQTLYSLEAEAIAEYWFDKYGTTYPEEFDVESVGMVWGDGAAHATWFSAEVEMIKAINFLPFHGGSLYLSEMARDGEAVIDEITELNDGPPDVWQSLISQYEALVNPVEAWNNFSLDGDQKEEGQSPAFTYYWMATLANLGTPTSAIRGDHPLSAVFQNGETNTYTAHNAGSETITVTFNDGVAFSVAPGTTRSTTGSASDPVDPPTDPPVDPPAEDITYGYGLLEPDGPNAYDTTGFDLGEFHSNINFSHRATADPLVDPGNGNFWHAHDFFVNPSTDPYSTIESLMEVDGSSAQPANNESVYWVPSMINETNGEYVTPLDSSIAYYRITKPFDPDKLEAMPTGLSIIAGAAMPRARQSIGLVAWNYIGTSERYDHLPIGDEWQDLPLQAIIFFPMFWDGENLDSADHKSHMAYADASGGPSTHPYLLPQLELQIHYGHVPQDAQLVLTSDIMTKDHPDYAPGWSLHADTIHLPWPEYDDDGILYDGFERRVNDTMRFPIIGGTDGQPARTIPTGAQQPFTPAPFITYGVFPGQDPSNEPDTRSPVLVTAIPSDGSVDIPVDTNIVLIFDEDVVAGEGMIHLMTGPVDDPLTTPVESHTSVEMFAATDSRVQIEGNRVTIALQNRLEFDTTYHLDIGSSGDAFLDLAGNGFQRDHAEYSFTSTDGVGVDFTITWPGSDVWMGVGNTSTIYGQVNDVTDVVSMSATIQNVETGLYQRTDGTFGEVDYFDITVNAYDSHWFFLQTPAAGGTYRVEVFATDRAENITKRDANFSVHGDPPNAPTDPPVEDPPVEDPPVSDPPASDPELDLVAETTSVSLLVHSETGLAYVQDVDGEPIPISRSDGYWSGDVPLTRDGSSLLAAARDDLGRLRVLDVGEWGPYAWILDESGLFIGEEGPNDSSVVAKEILFHVDLDGDGVIGQNDETTPPAEPPATPDPGGDVLADGVQVRLMTFNVYYASLGSAERIDGIAQAIADYTPDIASIQEMWGEKDQILAAIEAKTGLDYALSVGSNTWDGDILYRADRWQILDDGVITYDGSRGMSYATLEHLSTGEKISVYGMHPLAGVSEDYHLRNIEMATEHMAASAYAGEAPVVLLGDMNAHENSESMRLIRDGSLSAFGQDWTAPVTFEDSFRVANGDGANGDTGFGVKIDYVYLEGRVDPAFRIEGASIRNDAPGGSDHFPVMAEVVLLF